jgi:hypothetical protein
VYYVATMKWQALIVLLAIALSIAVPPSLPFLSDRGAMAAIGTLDVCHSATPALFSSGDMPCMSECAGLPLPLTRNNAAEIADSPFQPFSLAFQDERPPKH